MILAIIFLLLVFILVSVYVINTYDYDIIFTLIKGLMFGMLFAKEELEDYTESTLQLCIGFITITVIYYTDYENN